MTPGEKMPPDAETPGGGTRQVFAGSANLHSDYTLPLFELLDTERENRREIERWIISTHTLLGDYGIPARDDPAVTPLPHPPEWWDLYEQLTVAVTQNYYQAARWILTSLERMCDHA